MNNKDHEMYFTISAYLDKRMDDESVKQFEAEMAADPELKEIVDYFPLMELAWEAKIHEEGRQALDNVYATGITLDPLPKTRILGINSSVIIRLAAAIIIFLVLAGGFTIYKANLSNTPEILYATYFNEYRNLELIDTRSISTDFNDQLRRSAYNQYDQGNYSEFINSIGQLPESYDQKMNDLFYLGIAYLQTEQWASAEETLEQIAGTSTEYGAEANWYLALTYLRTGKCEQAQSLFEEVRDKGPDNSQRATKILRKLNCS